MQLKRLCAGLILGSMLCTVLSGCAQNQGNAEGLWVGISANSESEDSAKFEDGTYLSQTVHEPKPDPYKDDTKHSKDTEKDGVRYALYQKHAEIIGHTDDFSAEEFVIPNEIEGLPVTKIAHVQAESNSIFEIDKNGGFYSCYSLKTVTIPEGMTDIGNYAFYGCKNLKEIELPESVARIGDRTFAMCSNLSKMTIPAAIERIGDSAFSLTPWYDSLLFHRDLVIFNGTVYDAGRRCTGTVTVPDYVIAIGDYAFYSCPGLQAVILPESVKTIGKYAFCDCPDLRSVVFLNPECEIPSEKTTISNKLNGATRDFYRGIIYGIPDSTAETFAKKLSFRFEDTDEFERRQQQERIRALTKADKEEEDSAPETTAPSEESKSETSDSVTETSDESSEKTESTSKSE